ncbi:MAG: STAS domain-containing protein [Candidatus Sulfotelmatobacter sp.]
MSVILDQAEKTAVICLEGEVDIASAAELKEALVRAISSGTEVRVDLSGAVEVDATTIQLLYAAWREAEKAGTLFRIAGQVPEPIHATICEAGFENLPIPVVSEAENSSANPTTAENRG